MADYDDTHVERVRLVRALVDVGRLSTGRVREVVAAGVDPSEAALAGLEGLGVPGCGDSPASLQLARALTAAEAAGWPVADTTC